MLSGQHCLPLYSYTPLLTNWLSYLFLNLWKGVTDRVKDNTQIKTDKLINSKKNIYTDRNKQVGTRGGNRVFGKSEDLPL